MEEVNSEDKTLRFKNAEGETTENFHYLYTHPDSKTNPILENNGLSKDGTFVNVDKETLQSVNYNNVFAVGDCNDLPL